MSAALLAVLVAAPPPASPVTHPAVAVAVDPCLDIHPGRLEEQLALELDPDVDLIRGGTESVGVTYVQLGCGDDDAITMDLRDPVTRKSMNRTLDRSEVPEGAEVRMLALTVAEFVAASWVELTLPEREEILPPASPPPPPPEPIVRTARRVATRPPRPWSVSGGLGGSVWGGRPIGLGRASLRVTHWPHAHVGWSADVGGGFTSVRADGVSGRVELVPVDGSAMLLGGARLGRTRLAAGAGARAGALLVRGRPEPGGPQGESFTVSWGGPVVTGRVDVDLGRRMLVGVSLEGGAFVAPTRVRANETLALELRGAWGTAGLHLGGRI